MVIRASVIALNRVNCIEASDRKKSPLNEAVISSEVALI